MASDRSLGTLTLQLLANITGFTDGMSKAQRAARYATSDIKSSMDSISNSVRNALAVFGVGLSLKGLYDLVDGVAQASVSLDRLSQKTGVSASALSVYKLAAKETGTDIDGMAAAFERFDKTASQATSGSKEQVAVFDAIGISSGQLKKVLAGPDGVQGALNLVSQKMAGYRDDQNKTALAQALFGRSGADLLPMLNQLGTDGFGALQKHAQDLGVYLDGPAIEAAKAYDKEMSDFTQTVSGLSARFVNDLLPSINQLLSKTTDGTVSVKDMRSGVDDLAGSVKNAAVFFVSLYSAVETAATYVAAAGQNFSAFIGLITTPRQHNVFDIADNVKDAVSAVKTYQQALVSNSKVYDSQVKQIDDDAQTHVNAILGAASKIKPQAAAAGNKPSAPSLPDVAGQERAIRLAQELAAAYQGLFDETAKLTQQATSNDPLNQAYEAYQQTIVKIDKDAQDVIQKGGNIAKVQAQVADAVSAAGKILQSALSQPGQDALALQQSFEQQLADRKALLDAQAASIGMGDKEAATFLQLAEYSTQAADAIQQLTAAYDKIKNPLPETTAAYQQSLQDTQNFWASQATLYQQGQAAVDAANQNWLNGVSAALADFNEQEKNVAATTKTITTDAINGLSDAFTEMITDTKSAKDALKDFFNSLAAEVTEAIVKGWLNTLLQLGSTSGTSGTSTSGGWFTSLLGSLFGGGKAVGGPVNSGMFYRVNENGPELLSVGGRDFLMMGRSNGNIAPVTNSSVSNQRSTTVNNTILVPPTTTRRTAEQVAQAAQRAQQRATARNS